MNKYYFNFENDIKQLDRSQIKEGQLVAYEYKSGRGVALMRDGEWFYSAYTLIDKEVCVCDFMPYEVQLLVPSKEDIYMAIDNLVLPDDYSFVGCSDVDALFPNATHGIGVPVKKALEKLQNSIEDQSKLQDHIVKRWQNKYDQEIRNRESLRLQWEEESKQQKDRIKELEDKLAEKACEVLELEEEVDRLKKVPSEDEFVKRLVKETKNLYKHEKEKTDVVRQILYKVGRSKEEAELDAWIERREKKFNIKTNKIEVGTLNAEAVNDVHGNNNVNLGKDGSEG
jgi:hypothetical protein